MAELNIALDKIKFKKSCGMDGISTKLLKKIVPSVTNTFLNAFNECFLKGAQLDQSLKTAYIRLVSKGGRPQHCNDKLAPYYYY